MDKLKGLARNSRTLNLDQVVQCSPNPKPLKRSPTRVPATAWPPTSSQAPQRHIMVTKDGQILHMDFGHFLGHLHLCCQTRRLHIRHFLKRGGRPAHDICLECPQLGVQVSMLLIHPQDTYFHSFLFQARNTESLKLTCRDLSFLSASHLVAITGNNSFFHSRSNKL